MMNFLNSCGEGKRKDQTYTVDPLCVNVFFVSVSQLKVGWGGGGGGMFSVLMGIFKRSMGSDEVGVVVYGHLLPCLPL